MFAAAYIVIVGCGVTVVKSRFRCDLYLVMCPQVGIAPNLDLQLEWVYGFKSECCRNNVKSLSSSEIVYFVERLGVVLNVKCRQQRFYFGHSEDIMSMAVHSSKSVIASGQIGDRPYICIWDPLTMESISILKNRHQYGISALDFDSDGERLASVGMEKKCVVIIWDWKIGRVLACVEDKSCQQILFIHFSPFESGRLVTGGLKSFKFWNMSDGYYLEGKHPRDWGTVGGIEAKTMLCAVYATNELVYSGSLSGNIYKWKSDCLDSVMENVHRGGVTVINCDSDGNYVTAGKDGHVQLWTPDMKPRSRIDLSSYSKSAKGLKIRVAELGKVNVLIGKADNKMYQISTLPIHEIDCIVQGPSDSGEVNALAVHPQRLIFADGSKDGFLRLWTAFDRKLMTEINLGVSINCCQFRPQGNHLAIGTSRANVIVLRFPDLDEVCSIRDISDNVWVLKYSPDGVYLAVGKSDGFLIYNVYKNYTRVGDVSGCKTPPIHLDWSISGDHIQVVNVNHQRFVFRIHDGKTLDDSLETSSLIWSTWTCPAGYEINGVWPRYSKESDYVVSVDANLEANVMVTGHKNGLFRLHQFPKFDEGGCKALFTGHSSNVINVQFSQDKSRVISMAENCKAIFQWLVCGHNIGGNQYQVEFLPCDVEAIQVNEDFALDCDIVKEMQLLHSCLQYKASIGIDGGNLGIGRDGERRAPKEGLQLQFIFGSFDCRNNLHFTATGNIVYHVAAVGVVYWPQERSQTFYLGHTNDILCICICKSSDMVATGQIGAVIHVWNAKTLSTQSILEESNNCNAILGLSFSSNGSRLLSRCLHQDGQRITIWDWANGENLASTESVSDCILTVDWHGRHDNRFITAGVRHLRFWTRLGNGFIFRNATFDGKTIGKNETLLCVTTQPSSTDQDRCYTGSAVGNIYEWENGGVIRFVKAHDGPVFCLHSLDQGFISGGKDGVILLWDDFIKHPNRTFPVLKSYAICKGSNRIYLAKDRPAIKACDTRHGTIAIGSADGDILLMENNGYYTIVNQVHPAYRIFGVDSHPFVNKLVTYGEDMTIRTWDLDTFQMISCKTVFRLGYCVSYSFDGNLIAAGHGDGSVEILNAITLDTLEIFHNKTSAVVAIKFSPQPNGYLAVAHEDSFVDVFSSVCPWRWRSTCDSKLLPVTKLSWDDKESLLFIFTSNSRFVYEIPSGIEVILPLQSDQPNFNSSLYVEQLLNYNWDASHDSKLVATNHGSGQLRLMDFPIKMINPASKWYLGHGHSMGVLKWCFNDDLLVTTNNSGAAILIWNRRISAGDRKISYDSDESDEEHPDEDIDSEIEEELNATELYKEQRPNKILNSRKCKERGSCNKAERPFVEKEWKKSCELPNMQLDYVYGYSGRGYSNNLHYLEPSGEIVYPISSTAVVLNTITGGQSFYNNHTDSITALAVNYYSSHVDMVASAQLTDEPAVHVWSCKSLQNVSMLTISSNPHAPHCGLRSINFSGNGQLLLGLGYNNVITIWRWIEGCMLIQMENHRNSPIYDMKFRPNSDKQMLSVGRRHVKFWTIVGSRIIGRRGVVSSVEMQDDSDGGGNEVLQTMLSATFGKGDISFTGAADGKIYEWKKHILQRVLVQAHSGPVFTMHLSLTDGLIVTGSKIVAANSTGDEFILKLWDPQMTRCKPFPIGDNITVKAIDRSMGKLLIGTSDNCIYKLEEKTGVVHKIMNGCVGKVNSVVCHPKQSIVVSIDEHRTIRIWDINRRKMKAKLNMEHEMKCIDLDEEGDVMALGSSRGHVFIVDVGSLTTIYQKRDHDHSMTSIRISKANRYLATLFEDGSLNVYAVGQRWRQLNRVGHWSGVEHRCYLFSTLQFSNDSKYLAVFRNNLTDILLLSVPNGYRVKTLPPNDWTDQTISLGQMFERHCSECAREDNHEVTTCFSMTPDKSMVAVGTNTGRVAFIPFPITKSEMSWNQNHCSTVRGVGFTVDKSYVVTADDTCVKVWQLLYHPIS